MKKVIFDTDPGIDDTMALMFAHASPNIELLGITTTFGNATIENATRNALYVKERFGLKATVCQGHPRPLMIEPDQPATFVHGENGLGDIDIPDEINGKADPRSAAQFIADTIRENPGEISIVAVGRMTNLALALEIAPDIASKVKEVVIMGGAFGHNGNTGNVTPFAEANIIGDPHAADIVVSASWPVTMVGLDVTQQVIMTTQYLETLRTQAPNIGAFIWGISRFYQEFHKKGGLEDGFYVHDSSAFMYLLYPEFFETVSGPIRVITDGPAIGHTMQKTTTRKYPIDDWADNKGQKVCCNVDAESFLQTYANTIIAIES
ncbi:nucleoside hydrolase [Shewanella sp. 125m-4]